jgi:hypothetical protein
VVAEGLAAVSRRAQPYRKGSNLRVPGAALTAMRRGRTAAGYNPADLQRNVQMLMRAGKGGKRPQRPTRPQRPARPSR